MDPAPAILSKMSVSIIWVGALLATLLGLPRLYRQDITDGFIDQLLISPQPLSVIILGKMTAHWLFMGLPLVFFAPIGMLLLDQSMSDLFIMMLTLLLVTPILTMIGAMIASLTASFKRNGFLLGLLTFPLYIPILIFAAGTVVTSQQHLSTKADIALLLAILIACICVIPSVCAYALRLGVNLE